MKSGVALLAGLVSAFAQAAEPGRDAWHDPENPIVKIFKGNRLDHWSFQPVQRPAVPDSFKGQPIDRFIHANLKAKKLSPAPMASRQTLIRRLTFGLTGLPPTPAAVQQFVNNRAPQAYERLVDRLLASPDYGIHWARHWLDIVRYADTNGHERDEFRPTMHRYRDYIIRAFNQDKPFDQFIVEQLAGDELRAGPPRTQAEADPLIATGYMRLGTLDSTAKIFDEEAKARNELMADLVNTTSSAFLGLTMSCANCHNHKYDPISQADHFRLRALFAAVKPSDDTAINLAPEQDEIRQHNDRVEERAKGKEKAASSLLAPAKMKITAARRAKLPAEIQKLMQIDSAKRNREQKKELQPHLDALKVSDKDALVELSEKSREKHTELLKQAKSIREERRLMATAMTMTDGKPQPTYRLLRGDVHKPREEVLPGFLSIYDPRPAAIAESPGGGTGRRLALARWIATPKNPFTPRVIVNRVWQHHFGRGLVATPNDFGHSGAAPTHPRLLDWLAAEFTAQGWSLKKLQRLILLSDTYRRTSMAPPQAGDMNNLLLWRQNVQRLTGEATRDAMLFVSGELVSRREGPPLWPPVKKEILQTQPGILEALEGKDGDRRQGWYSREDEPADVRSLFLARKRTLPLPFLQVFDLPESTISCGRRDLTTVAPQALNLLNSPLAVRLAKAFAARVHKESGDDPSKQIEHAVWLALGRAPTDAEREFAARAPSLAELCRALLNVNEFVYID